MFSNDGRSLLKRIAVLALCAFISIAYMPGVAYALEGEEAEGNGNQVEEPLEGENADAAAVNESGPDTGSGEEAVVEEEQADEDEPVIGEDPDTLDEEEPADEEAVSEEEVNDESAGSEEYPQLQPYTDYYIDCSDGYVWYTFTPEEDEYYVIYSSDYNDSEGGDPCINVYAGDPEDYSDSYSDYDISDLDYNFRLRHKFTAGTTYYFRFGKENSKYIVRIEKAVMTTVTFNTNKPTDTAWFDYADPETYEESRVSSKTMDYEVGAVLDYYIPPEYSYDSGLVFLGYSADKNAEIADTNITVTENMQLYGVWRENKFIDLTEGKEVTVTEADKYTYYRFVVPENGNYQVSLASHDRSYYEINQYTKSFDYSDYAWGRESVKLLMRDQKQGTVSYLKFTNNDGDDKTYNVNVVVKKVSVSEVTFHTGNDKAYYERYDEASDSYVHKDTDVQTYAEGDVIYGSGTCINTPDYDETVGFLGWSTSENAAKPDREIIVGTEPMDVYGVWENNTPVVFHANNDNAYMTSQQDDDGNVEYYESQTSYLSKNQTIDKWYYTPSRKDDAQMLFLGWATDPDAVTPESSIRVTGSGQMDLYAVWQIYYGVIYDANGGYFYEGGDTNSHDINKGDPFYVMAVMNEDPFKVFDGWYDAETGGKKYTEADIVNGDLTVFAHWKDTEASEMKDGLLAAASNSGKNVYSFTPAEDGTYAFNSAEPYSHFPKATLYNSSKEVLAENEHGGYNGNFFLTCSLKAGQTYTLVIDHQSWGDADYKITVRKVDLSTVTYVANHEGAYLTDDEDNKVSMLTKEYAAGYQVSDDKEAASDSEQLRFLGWSKEQDAKEADAGIIVRSDITLYGVWEESARITFHSNNDDIYYDSDEDEGTTVYDYDYERNLKLGRIIDIDYDHEFMNTAGYTFLGWSTQEGATEAEESITVTSDLTDLYAVWEKNPAGHQDEVIPIALNETKTVNYEGFPVRFSFVPDEDGIYMFKSSDNSADPYATLYDEDMNQLARNDDDGSDVNFCIARELKKGAEYYLEVREYNSGRTGTRFNVKVTKPATYTVTFHANDKTAAFYDDGDGSNLGTEHTETYLEGDVIRNSTDFDPAYLVNNNKDKRFSGWSTTPSSPSGEEESITVNGDIDVYAVWKPLVNVRLNVNSDKATFREYSTNNNVKTSTIQVLDGQAIGQYEYDSFDNVPDSKVFMGWATSADATKPSNNIVASSGLELYAVWADSKVITFDANGGTFDKGDFIRVRTFAPGSEFFFDTEPLWKDDSKVFIGWATTPDAEIPDVYEEEPVYTGLDTVYAVWADAVRVTYDANGGFMDTNGEGSYTGLFEKGSTFIRHYAYYDDSDLYRFGGWYTAKEGGEPVYNTVLTDDMTVYAHWDKTHAVTMHANGGYFGTAGNVAQTRYFTDNETFFNGEYDIPETDAANTIFAGWATTANAETPDIIPGKTNMKGITEVFAVWETSITITLHANGGYFDETSSDTVSFKAKKGSRLSALEYYEALNNDAYKRDDGKRALSKTGAALASDYVLNSNTDLYVIWTDLVDVTYDAGDGVVYGEGSKTYTVKVAKNEPWNVNEFTAVNNSEDIGFLGWSVTPDGKSVVQTITPGSKQTLYAAYAEGPKVTLQATAGGTVRGTVNGATISQANNSFIWAKGLKLKDLDIYGEAKDGYIFLGFSTSTEEKDIVPADYEPKGAVTLYAIFAQGYNVELDAYPGHFQGSGSSDLTVPVRKGEAVGAVGTPVYTDHVLVGWRDNDTGVMIAPEDLASYIPSGDVWLSAIWEEVAVHVTGVKLNKTAANMQAGKTLQLTAAVTPGDATNKEVVWSSSDTSVATVDATGRVTGKKAGTAVITAKTVDGEITAECTVKVFGKTKVISGHTYTLVSLANKTVSFTKAKNTATVTVPATVKINGVSFKVTQVGAKAFSGTKIKTVTIGSNVTTINSKAFTGSKITKVTIGKNVNKIKASAFYGNSKGKSLMIIMKTAKLTKSSTFKGFMKGTKAKSVTITVSVGTAAKNKKTRTAYKKIFTKSNVGIKVTIK